MSPELLKIALILSVIALGLSVIVLPALLLLGWIAVASLAMFGLFSGVFPLFFGVAILVQKRMQGQNASEFIHVLFVGLPKWFRIAFRLYHALFGVIVVTGIVLVCLKSQMALLCLGLLFFLAPSWFYCICIVVYWSELRLQTAKGPLKDHRQTQPPPAETLPP